MSRKQRLRNLEGARRERAKRRAALRDRPDVRAILTAHNPDRLAGLCRAAVSTQLVPSPDVPECVWDHPGNPCDNCRHWQAVALKYYVNLHRADHEKSNPEESFWYGYAVHLFPEVIVPDLVEIALSRYYEERELRLNGPS